MKKVCAKLSRYAVMIFDYFSDTKYDPGDEQAERPLKNYQGKTKKRQINDLPEDE